MSLEKLHDFKQFRKMDCRLQMESIFAAFLMIGLFALSITIGYVLTYQWPLKSTSPLLNAIWNPITIMLVIFFGVWLILKLTGFFKWLGLTSEEIRFIASFKACLKSFNEWQKKPTISSLDRCRLSLDKCSKDYEEMLSALPEYQKMKDAIKGAGSGIVS